MLAFMGFPGGSAGKESACNVGDLGWKDPLEVTHSSILAWRDPTDRGAWRATVQESQSRTRVPKHTQHGCFTANGRSEQGA